MIIQRYFRLVSQCTASCVPFTPSYPMWKHGTVLCSDQIPAVYTALDINWHSLVNNKSLINFRTLVVRVSVLSCLWSKVYIQQWLFTTLILMHDKSQLQSQEKPPLLFILYMYPCNGLNFIVAVVSCIVTF